jgi:hypothetical protein
VSLRKKPAYALLGFRVVNCLDGEVWFCRKASLKVEMVTDEDRTFSEFRGADSKKHQACNTRALENLLFLLWLSTK